MVEKVFTNCFLVKNDLSNKPEQICLAMKKRGFGQGLWNGSGGKPEGDENIEQTAVREVEQEFKVTVESLEKRGEIVFHLREEGKQVVMHTFLTTKWQGEPTETEEMKPRWFNVNNVPYEQMWKSDKEWLSIILSGKKIKAKYTYSHEGGEVETREIFEVNSFD